MKTHTLKFGNKEYIACAAIWYKDLPLIKEGLPNQNPVNVDRGIVFCGHRHVHAMYSMCAITGKRSVEPEVGEYEQGFLTSKNRFVSRAEAFVLAVEAGQIEDDRVGVDLYSEDIY